MSNNILITALSDFNLNSEDYATYNRSQLEKITDNVINDSTEKKTLSFSQQIILNNKKKRVSFTANDSPEYNEVIKNEKKLHRQNNFLEYSPCLEYIDVCMAAASKRSRKAKIDCKKYL